MLLQPLGNAGAFKLPTTPTHDQTPCANSASQNVMAANANRLGGSYLVNPNQSVVFWISEGQDAVVGEGFPLFYGGVYDIRTTDDVYAIQSSGSSKSINSLEVTTA